MLRAVVKSLRPHQWVKNLFVGAPLVFARLIGDHAAAGRAAAAVASFCLLSSAVYVINDIVDLEKDRAHPTKRRRPLASGALSVRAGRILAVMLAAAALAIAVLLGRAFAVTAVAYLLLNFGYSVTLKKYAFVDVGCISMGFLLRVLGGAVAIDVPTSRWLLACTLLLSALLGFGKRAHELRVAGDTGHAQREVLGRYDPVILRRLLVVLGVLTTATYLAYTRSERALGMFVSGRLIWTVPFVAFGVFRFVWITVRQSSADSPTDSMLRDPAFVTNLALYVASVLGILYLG
jgi:decaprenyl-phosphate phosphoribosyltransferase